MRVIFKKGKQRKFLKDVLKKVNCPSLRSFDQFGLDVPYSTLKNYYNESRTLPVGLFRNLLYLSKINEKDLCVEYLGDNWGQVKGGRKCNGPAKN